MEEKSLIQSKVFAPNPLLAPYVSAFLFNEIEVHTDGAFIDLFPVGYAVMSFALDDLPLYFKNEQVISKFNITGQLTRHYRMITAKGNYRTVMVVLKPCGAYKFLGISQDDLVDRYTDLLEIFPDFKNTYTAILNKSEDPENAIQLIEKWLLTLLEQSKPNHKFDSIAYVSEQMMINKGNVQLNKIYKDIGMSKSTLERHFKEKIGLNPKLYNRIIRFNETYKTITSLKYENWQDIVSQFGYFDQAHFIKEFKIFYGFVPSQLQMSKLNIAGHVSTI